MNCELQAWQSRTGYFPSVLNVLTNTRKLSPITKGEKVEITFPENDKKHDKSALMEISEAFGTLSRVGCESVL